MKERMKPKTIKTIEAIVCLAMPCILAASIVGKLWYLPLIAFFLVIIMFGILVNRTKGILEDEMTRAIDQKGGKAAVFIGSLAMILTGMVLLGINGDYSSGTGIVAITLYSTAVGLNLINYFTNLFFKAKLGGK
jgi:uncharacterized membrane protein